MTAVLRVLIVAATLAGAAWSATTAYRLRRSGRLVTATVLYAEQVGRAGGQAGDQSRWHSRVAFRDLGGVEREAWLPGRRAEGSVVEVRYVDDLHDQVGPAKPPTYAEAIGVVAVGAFMVALTFWP